MLSVWVSEWVIKTTHLNTPWSRSVAVTVSTVVPGPLFSITWASNSVRWNTGASSFTSITCTDSTWEVESWGIPWSSATMVRLKTSCSSRSKALRMEREPAKEKKQTRWELSRLLHFKSRFFGVEVCVCRCVYCVFELFLWPCNLVYLREAVFVSLEDQ